MGTRLCDFTAVPQDLQTCQAQRFWINICGLNKRRTVACHYICSESQLPAGVESPKSRSRKQELTASAGTHTQTGAGEPRASDPTQSLLHTGSLVSTAWAGQSRGATGGRHRGPGVGEDKEWAMRKPWLIPVPECSEPPFFRVFVTTPTLPACTFHISASGS